VPRPAIAGQRTVFLVSIDVADGGSQAPVEVVASAAGATVEVQPAVLHPGWVAEVIVTPDAATAPTTLTVQIAATRGTHQSRVERGLAVVAPDPLQARIAEQAAWVRARFEWWLIAYHPELGIKRDTPWDAMSLATSGAGERRHVFVWRDWEMRVSWQPAAAPDDRARIFLRRRYVERSPGFAAEITSLSLGTPIHEIEPPPDEPW